MIPCLCSSYRLDGLKSTIRADRLCGQQQLESLLTLEAYAALPITNILQSTHALDNSAKWPSSRTWRTSNDAGREQFEKLIPVVASA